MDCITRVMRSASDVVNHTKDSPKWIKNMKTTINPKSNDDNCF